jgi:hypothetical protein
MSGVFNQKNLYFNGAYKPNVDSIMMRKSFKRKRLKKLEIELNRRCIKFGEKREIKRAAKPTKKAIFNHYSFQLCES